MNFAIDLKNLPSSEEAKQFLKISKEFKLGKLQTELPHPDTKELSHQAKSNLESAITSILNIDKMVFIQLEKNLPFLQSLISDIKETLDNNGRIFLCGCGATGRLSLSLETIWRHKYKNQNNLKDKIISFMAGGDVALIHSIEKFEDFPEFGKRQLIELGFKDGDLLISCTEGGETPFVIGATEAATQISKRKPYFLYCNPDAILKEVATRSKNVLENDNIKKINLTVGPMALTGSTRMQSTTILMYAVGLCLEYFNETNNLEQARVELKKLMNFLESKDFFFLKQFIEEESKIYKNNEYIFYETDAHLGMAILTDTTERSPTFSLYPFENQNDNVKIPSLSYLYFKDSKNPKIAWNDLLQREPRTFYWPEVTSDTNENRLYGFNFSSELINLRKKYLNAKISNFKILYNEKNNGINFELNHLKHELVCIDLNFLSVQIVLKIAMNNLSTLIMGRMDRYESNLMTWVRPSNNKLIDRTLRYADYLLKAKGKNYTYEELALTCFRLKEQISRDKSLVLALVSELS